MSIYIHRLIQKAFIISTVILAQQALAIAPINDLAASYQFLLGNSQNQGGALYYATASELNGKYLPLSYYDSADYWGDYVCHMSGNLCAVKDVYSSNNYTLLPEAGHAGDLQTERVNVHNGTDIYDAATWQIAIVLGPTLAAPANDHYALANNENLLLKYSYDGNATKPSLGTNRGVTNGNSFVYNNHNISDVNSAYSFRMLSRNWLSTDPFMNTGFQDYITTTALPKNPEYKIGKVTWSDWKPITGENSWAFLLGPLQAAQIHYVLHNNLTYIPFESAAVQNAINVLPTFAAMQSPIGGIYYVPSGTYGNQGTKPVNPHEVSNENNFSTYAGLVILEKTLTYELQKESSLDAIAVQKIHGALSIINVMLHGGQNAGDSATKGLLYFFKNDAWKDGEFIQGGLADDPKQPSHWVPNLEPKAVDVNTWGIAALGPSLVDQWFGFGASYKAWQQVKHFGGYGVGTTLWGVGYSDKDGNGIDANGDYKQGILSAEWTAGAINMVRDMITYYQAVPKNNAHFKLAQDYLTSLQADEQSMIINVQKLRFSNYEATSFPGKPANYKALLPSETFQPYLYASKRYMIPFGWFANPIPSTCSTSWMIMLAHHYDPFQYDGK